MNKREHDMINSHGLNALGEIKVVLFITSYLLETIFGIRPLTELVPNWSLAYGDKKSMLSQSAKRLLKTVPYNAC